MDTRLTVIGVSLFLLGILILALLLNRVFKRLRFQDTGDPKNKPPRRASILFMLLALISIVLAQSCFWLSSQLKYFRPFGQDRSIGILAIEWMNDPIKSLRVNYTPAYGDSAGVENSFYLSGDSWRFSGEILRFKFAGEYLLLPEECYKTVEFEGRFLGRLPPNTSGELFNEEILEGGKTNAFTFFRDTKYFKWFAEVDSFASDFINANDTSSYRLNIQNDGTTLIRMIR